MPHWQKKAPGPHDDLKMKRALLRVFAGVEGTLMLCCIAQTRQLMLSWPYLLQGAAVLLIYGLLTSQGKTDRIGLLRLLCGLVTLLPVGAYGLLSNYDGTMLIFAHGIVGALLAIMFLSLRTADVMALLFVVGTGTLAAVQIGWRATWPAASVADTFRNLLLAAGIYGVTRTLSVYYVKKEREEVAAVANLHALLHKYQRLYRQQAMVGNALPAGVYRMLADEVGTLQLINHGFTELTGYVWEDVLTGRVNWQAIIHPDDWAMVREEMSEQAALHPDGSFDVECRIVTSAGQTLWVNNRGAGGIDEETGERWLSGLLMNITETYTAQLRLLETQYELSAANNAKSDFLAHMSHEIRTPIHAVAGLADLMLLSRELPPGQQANVLGIRSAAQTLLYLVNDILDFSKISAGQMQILPAPFELAALLEDLRAPISLRARDKRLHFCLRIQPDLPRSLIGDEVRLKQVLLNLLTNAVKFTAEGTVTLRITGEPSAGGWVVRYEVEDTGSGIRDEDLGRLFEDFQQLDALRNRAQEGSGLGLAISQRLVGLMGGGIAVRSRYGEGSCFAVTLTHAANTAEPLARVEEAGERRLLVCGGDVAWQKEICADAAALGVPVAVAQGFVPDAVYTHLLVAADDPAAALWRVCAVRSGASRALVYPEPSAAGAAENEWVLASPVHVGLLADLLNNCQASLDQGRYIEQLTRHVFATREAVALIVDDNPANLLVGSALLRLFGLTVREATSGEQALEMLAEQHFDLVFMDHMMPGLDGESTVRHLRARPALRQLPVVVLTANTADEVAGLFADLNVQAILTKPLELGKLSAVLRQLLPAEKVDWSASPADVDGLEAPTARAYLQAVPGLDYQAGMLHCAGDEALYLSLLSAMVGDCREKAGLLRGAAEAADWRTITLGCHSLKSALASIGQRRLSAQAEGIEALARKAQALQTRLALPDFLGELEVFIAALDDGLCRLPRETQLEFVLSPIA